MSRPARQVKKKQDKENQSQATTRQALREQEKTRQTNDKDKKQQEEDEGKVGGVGETKKAHGQATQKKVTRRQYVCSPVLLNIFLDAAFGFDERKRRFAVPFGRHGGARNRYLKLLKNK